MVRDLILCYHSIWGSDEAGSDRSWGLKRKERALPQEEFENQIKWLSTFCEFCTVSEMIGTPSSGRWRVAITFDDGYYDNVLYAIPILKKYGGAMTWFIPTKFIEEDEHLPWWDLSDQVLSLADKPVEVKLPEGTRLFDTLKADEAQALKRTLRNIFRETRDEYWHLNYDSLCNLVRDKRPDAVRNSVSNIEQLQNVLTEYQDIELAAHTHSHLNFFADPEDIERDDLQKNMDLLAKWCPDATVSGFAYPYGSMRDDPVRIELLKEFGIQWAVTTEPDYYKSQNNYLIPRLVVQNGWSLKRFKIFAKYLTASKSLRKLKGALRV